MLRSDANVRFRVLDELVVTPASRRKAADSDGHLYFRFPPYPAIQLIGPSPEDPFVATGLMTRRKANAAVAAAGSAAAAGCTPKLT